MLAVYFDAYLNQDWMDDYPDPNVAFDAFVTESSANSVKQALAEFDQVLAMSEPSLLESLDHLSTNLDPRADYGWDEREWLAQLRERARTELEQRQVGSGATTKDG